MKLAIAMIISYLPLWWYMATEIYQENQAKKSTHPPRPHVHHQGKPYNTDGE